MRDPWNDSVLAQRFRELGDVSESRTPLNAALCRAIARRPELHGLLAHAPETQQAPVLLLAAIHFAVLAEPTSELAAWYPTVVETPRPPDAPELEPTLQEFVADRAATVAELVATHHTQTNEVGRCALFLPAFALLADECGTLAHIDVGTSAGLTTRLDRYAIRYDDGTAVRGPRAATPEVLITSSTRGAAPIELGTIEMPEFGATAGLDAKPVDVSDPDAARWLEACCWPDQVDRHHRLAAAIAVARTDPPDLITGDAVDALEESITHVAPAGHPVVTTSWALNYLSGERRREFVTRLDEIGAARDLSWVIAESPFETPELPHPDDLAESQLTALTMVTWRAGRRNVTPFATCHPHGYWIHWR